MKSNLGRKCSIGSVMDKDAIWIKRFKEHFNFISEGEVVSCLVNYYKAAEDKRIPEVLR